MARKSSPSRAAPSRPAPAPAPARAPAPAPAPVRQAPPPAPAHHAPPPAAAPAPSAFPPAQQQSGGGGMLAGLGATMAQGFAFGTGSALARQAVNSVFGGSSSSAPAPQQAAPAPAAPVPQAPLTGCENDHAAFVRCLQDNPTNASNCDFYFTALQACQNRNI